jgi:hypothetical protein
MLAPWTLNGGLAIGTMLLETLSYTCRGKGKLPWLNRQGVGLLVRRLWARVPEGVIILAPSAECRQRHCNRASSYAVMIAV